MMRMRLTIRNKLLGVIGLAFLIISTLSISSNIILGNNMEISEAVKEKDFRAAMLIESAETLARSMVNRLEMSASEALDDRLPAAKKNCDQVIEILNEAKTFLVAPEHVDKMNQLIDLSSELYRLGARRVEMVIDLQFAKLPGITGAFNEKAEGYKALISSLQGFATQNLESALDDIQKDSRAGRNLNLMVSVFGVTTLLILGFIISRTISRSIARTVDMGKAILEGNLTKRLDVKTNDEIRDLAGWFNTFLSTLQTMVTEIAQNADALGEASSGLSALASQMALSAEEVSAQSDTVAGTTEEMSTSINAMASAAEEMSANTQSVSSTAEQMSQNMNAVASSIEQMSVAINEVSLNTQEGAKIAGKAAEMSHTATDTMNALGNAAKEIGEVTDLIKRIAEQTNLLALNATIEAASAGDAGKGFAVVANEIKELANQSAGAAEDIAKRIEGVQVSTEEAVRVIREISDIIDSVNKSSSVVTKSVEQQKSAATEISNSIQQANTGAGTISSAMAEIARGANDVARSAAETAKGVNEVSANIQGVNKASDDSSASAQHVNSAAGKLAEISSRIQDMVSRFKV